jgi:molybdopterin-guanine dinucleotide biosynthesis protein A
VTSNKPFGVILAGGQGVRMGGQDKGLLEISGRKLIEYTLAALKPQVSKIIISANRHLSEYQHFADHVVLDISPHNFGPLGGIFSVMAYVETALTQCSDVDLLVVPCDMPLLPSDLGARLGKAKINAHRAVYVNDGNRPQPLCCLLPLSLKSQLKDYLQAGNRKVRQWFQTVDALEVDFSDEKSTFVNINSQEDLSLAANNLKADA